MVVRRCRYAEERKEKHKTRPGCVLKSSSMTRGYVSFKLVDFFCGPFFLWLNVEHLAVTRIRRVHIS